MSNADDVLLSLAVESTFGTLAASGWKRKRFVSEGLRFDPSFVESREITGDAQVATTKRVNIGASGPVNFELSYGEYDDELMNALRDAAWSSEVKETAAFDAVATGNKFTRASGDWATNFAVGDYIRTQKFSTAVNNGIFRISALTTLEITVVGATLVDETGGGDEEVSKGQQIENGTAVPSYSIEKSFTDLTTTYAQLLGQFINGFSLNFPVGDLITGSFDFVGKTEQSATSEAASGATASLTNDVMSTVDNMTALFENDIVQETNSFSLSVVNGARPRNVHGTLGPKSMGAGKCRVRGTLSMFFDDGQALATFNRFIASTFTSLAVGVTDSETPANSYIIRLPKVRLTGGQRVAGGEETDVEAAFDWSASKDATTGKTIIIQRIPGV